MAGLRIGWHGRRPVLGFTVFRQYYRPRLGLAECGGAQRWRTSGLPGQTEAFLAGCLSLANVMDLPRHSICLWFWAVWGCASRTCHPQRSTLVRRNSHYQGTSSPLFISGDDLPGFCHGLCQGHTILEQCRIAAAFRELRFSWWHRSILAASICRRGGRRNSCGPGDGTQGYAGNIGPLARAVSCWCQLFIWSCQSIFKGFVEGKLGRSFLPGCCDIWRSSTFDGLLAFRSGGPYLAPAACRVVW